jgi:very-short-patch-repair endonuclease
MSIVVEPFIRQLQRRGEYTPAPQARPHIQRQLRSAAERLLWNLLRDRRLDGHKFRRQYLIETWLADFVCLETGLVVEVHSTLTPALAAHADARRSFLESRGFKVLQLRDRDVLVETRAVLDMLRTALGWDAAGADESRSA